MFFWNFHYPNSINFSNQSIIIHNFLLYDPPNIVFTLSHSHNQSLNYHINSIISHLKRKKINTLQQNKVYFLTFLPKFSHTHFKLFAFIITKKFFLNLLFMFQVLIFVSVKLISNYPFYCKVLISLPLPKKQYNLIKYL